MRRRRTSTFGPLRGTRTGSEDRRWDVVRITSEPLPAYRSILDPRTLPSPLHLPSSERIGVVLVKEVEDLLDVGANWITEPVWSAEADARKAHFPDRPYHTALPPQPDPPELLPCIDPGPEPVESDVHPPGLSGWLRPWTIPQRRREAKTRFLRARAGWEDQQASYVGNSEANRDLTQAYQRAKDVWERGYAEFAARFDGVMQEWEQALSQFEAARQSDLTWLADLRTRYQGGQDFSAIADYALFVLGRSPYPVSFPRHVDLAFDPGPGIVVAEMQLPNLVDDILVLKPGRSGSEPFLRTSERERRQAYTHAIYAIMVRTAFELAKSDELNVLKLIVVNGWLEYTDRSTGQRRRDFVASVQAEPSTLKALELKRIDPKRCFRALRGTAAPGLEVCEPTSVRRIMQLDRSDGRIIAGRAVVDHLQSGTNLASMDWQDFEHLIRELFDKEFAASGAEVRVRRASRDYGVDAIAFDPDPIRGGKFVIQAKRYTDVVGVDAVRDLYGTITHEGANRGILVTTSRFGPESYQWANGKPISLIDGPQLLAMLRRHGHDYRIDLDEAKRVRSEGG